jgi:predicted nucleotidyltransferase
MNNPETQLHAAAAQFTLAVSRKSGVPTNRMGLTGSSLISLNSPTSDLDLIAYGEVECRKIHKTLANLREKGTIQAYSQDSIGHILENRWGNTGHNLSLYRDLETSKLLHGLSYGREYFWRFLKPTADVETSKPLSVQTVTARVVDDGDSIFTPCRYHVEPQTREKVSEFFSYRGKFTEQARIGDIVRARGILEEVSTSEGVIHRLILGGPGDYMLPVDAFDR